MHLELKEKFKNFKFFKNLKILNIEVINSKNAYCSSQFPGYCVDYMETKECPDLNYIVVFLYKVLFCTPHTKIDAKHS